MEKTLNKNKNGNFFLSINSKVWKFDTYGLFDFQSKAETEYLQNISTPKRISIDESDLLKINENNINEQFVKQNGDYTEKSGILSYDIYKNEEKDCKIY